MTFANPQHLVSTEWLAAHLDDPDLCVLECTVFLRRDPERGMRIESGRHAWSEGHIPGSGFADLTSDLADQASSLRFMMPGPEQFAEAMGRLGVGDGSRVVVYDRLGSMWAARVWWMLRAMGFDNAAVLDGGWTTWLAEGRPVSTDALTPPAADFTPRPRPERFATKEDVLAAMADGATCVVNALAREQHTGEDGGRTYGRAGHIPGSINLPAMELVDPETQAYLPADVLRERFDVAGATRAGRVITYCGGGIAASNDAFILTLLGQENVAVYDASLSEWAADPGLPLEVGA